VGAPRWSSEPRKAGRANTLTIFFEMRSNFSKNEHQTSFLFARLLNCPLRGRGGFRKKKEGKNAIFLTFIDFRNIIEIVRAG